MNITYKIQQSAYLRLATDCDGRKQREKERRSELSKRIALIKLSLLGVVAVLLLSLAGTASADPAPPITVDPSSSVSARTYVHWYWGHWLTTQKPVVVPGTDTAYSVHGKYGTTMIRSWTTYDATTAASTHEYQLGLDVTVTNWLAYGGYSDSYGTVPFTVTSDTDYDISGNYTTNANQGGIFRVSLKDLGTGTYLFQHGDALGTLSGPGLTGTLPPGDYEFGFLTRSVAWGRYPWAGVGRGPISGGPDQGTGSVHLDLTVPLNTPPDCSAATPSEELIWPPNHKFVPIGVLDVTDPEGDTVTITVDSIFQDEPVDTNGDGKFSPDGKGVGTATAEVRAERSGTKKVPGDGRVYHISFTAGDGYGGTCTGEVTVGVPHDQGKDGSTPVDGGALHDSTLP